MTIPVKLPKDFKMFQIRVLDVCPGCNGTGKPPRKADYPCPICNGTKVVATILHEGATLDILLAKVIEDASKHKVNEPVESEL